MTQLSIWKHWWVQSVIALGPAIPIPIITHWLSWTQSLEADITVGIAIWVIGMIFQIAHSLHSFHVDRLENKHVLDVIDEMDCFLLELQSRFRQIVARTLSGKPNYVFIDYCRRSLESSLKVARRAAQRGELEVQDHHFDTVDTVLAAFEGCKERTFRCVWLIEDGDLFDDSWRNYMGCLVQLSRRRRNNKQVQVRILFVIENDLDDAALLKRLSVARVLGFVSGEKRFECRLMSRRDYGGHLRDAGLAEQYLDFGVYGDHLLFRTTSYEPVNMGIFSVDPKAIYEYSRVHDVAMVTHSARPLPPDLPENVSLEQFLDCDRADAISEATVEREQ